MGLRKALCVGIDYYKHFNCLSQCVSDAENVYDVLLRNENGSPNFDVRIMSAEAESRFVPVMKNPNTGKLLYEQQTVGNSITAEDLKAAITELFKPDKDLEIALFYFAGHGDLNANGGYLCTSEIDGHGQGVSLEDVMNLADGCKAGHIIIILDSCHSGAAGNVSKMEKYCVLPENTIIMASCTAGGLAGDGCFTPLMVEALKGGAMNLTGEVTPGSVYAYIDRALGAFDQRPVFKANTESFVCLRQNIPPIELDILREIITIFPKADKDKALDPGYEEDKRTPIPGFEEHDLEKERVMKILRKYHSQNLVVPVDVPYMYDAAMKFKSCRLTALGKYYWALVNDNRI